MSPDLAASVHQRLLNAARSESRSCNELLQHYAENPLLNIVVIFGTDISKVKLLGDCVR